MTDTVDAAQVFALEELFVSNLRTTAWLVVSRHASEREARHALRSRMTRRNVRMRVTYCGRPL